MSEVADRIRLEQGDITEVEVDAVVNAANESLLGGGGVDGAIHSAAGPGLLEECRKIGGCETGEAVVTGGHELPADHVVHTVGPVWKGGDEDEDELLRSCYRSSLELAREHDLDSIAFPAISTGAYGFPLERATGIALDETRRFLDENDAPGTVTFVCFGDQAHETYREAYEERFGD